MFDEIQKEFYKISDDEKIKFIAEHLTKENTALIKS